jgi:hypothetical protein
VFPTEETTITVYGLKIKNKMMIDRKYRVANLELLRRNIKREIVLYIGTFKL